MNLLGQLAACNRLHSVYERCARWILMTHDRVKSDTLHLTQEFLGMMLGSRRSGVTIAVSTLKTAGFIRDVSPSQFPVPRQRHEPPTLCGCVCRREDESSTERSSRLGSLGRADVADPLEE